MASNYGAELSEQGIPVKSATDDQKVLDTRWVTFDIFAEPNYTNSLTLATDAPGGGINGTTTSYFVLYAHNLGFLPAFDYEINSLSISDGSADGTASIIQADAQNIYYIPNIASALPSITLSLNINLRIYNLPLTQEYQAPVIQAIPTTTPSASQYGVKFLNDNSLALDIHDASIDNYSFNTALRPLAVLQHGLTASNPATGSLTITYNYAQHPLFLLAAYSAGTYVFDKVRIAGPLVGALSFAGARGTVSSNQLTVTGQQAGLGSGTFAYILFKDPMDIAL